MPRIDDESKQQRMERIWLKVKSETRGIKESEIADELHIGRRTVNNYLRELEIEGKVFRDGVLWHPLNLREMHLRPFDLSPEEAVALYLGVRLLAKQHDKRNEPAETALFKLAGILKADAGVGDEIIQAAQELAQRPAKEGYTPIFRDVVRGYIFRKKVKIVYKPLGQNKEFETTFSTYLLEPSAVGFSTYLIGHSSIVNNLRSYKLERVQSVQLTNEDYEIPDSFDGLATLRSAWSIISGEKTVEIVLRFSPNVRERVLETRWHSSEKTEPDEEKEGWLRWTAKVADTTDMLPWIRGWGADVEALSPPSLQKELRKETKKLMNLYLGETPNMPPHYQLWAKAQRKDDEFHPLIYHLIDAGACAKELWENSLSEGFKKRITQSLPADLNEEGTGNLLAFLAATHDVGKASPSFQQKHEPSIERIKKAGFEFPSRHGRDPKPHGIVSTWALINIFKETFEMASYDARRFAHALGGHHGILPTTNAVNSLSTFDKGDEKWDQARRKLVEEMKSVFMPPDNFKLPEDVEEQNMFLMLLLGLTTTADWLGSDERFFDYEDRFFQPKDYALIAKEKAQKALTETGWTDDWQASGETVDFNAMFPFTPNEIQAKVIEAAADLPFPSLTILEAPTGIGKTEAALYLADTWLQNEKGRGLYIAMPTQATSNQIFERTVNFLNRRYEQKINIHLAHGQAEWNETMKELRLTSIGEGPADAENQMRAEAWFTPRKKTLLAPFGVGTVDQALMGILQSRHFYLRLFGLANKVVIFDEVHAYDTYMSQLFLRLLAWLRAVGSSVIVLSATLPEETRRAMVKVFAAQTPNGSSQAQYPRLTLVTAEGEKVVSLPAPADRTIQLKKITEDPQSIIQSLEEKLAQGGCAAVICNTVSRAQEIYAALQQADFVEADQLTLFHSRFPPVWRKKIEDKVLEQFGKGNKRPEKAIVVATQVIEQSLDLDFDLMISDLAPIDLLIQRIGRLHRHERDARPSGLVAPQLLIAQPEGDASAPQFGSSEYIYPRYILWQTWLAIQNRDGLCLPSETTALIEGVYGVFDAQNYPEEIAKELEKARTKMQKEFREDSYKAETNLVPHPNTENLVTNPMQDLKDDEDPTVSEQLKAITRLIPPGVNLVCLHKMDDETLNTEPDGSGKAIDLNRVPDKATLKELLLHSVALHRQDVVRLLAEKTHPKWQRKTALRYHIPLIFEKNRCPLEGTDLTLTLSKELGLQVQKEAL